MNDSLREFYGKPERRPRRFAGQLEPSFQETLRKVHADVKAEDCHFYHTLDLGGGRVIPGGWDIRGNEENYLGHIRYEGLRVLEFGAASGFLTFWMESRGAEVVALDLPPGHPSDLVPLPGMDLEAHKAASVDLADRVRNSWWYGHRERGSKARAVYADVYRLPGDLGRFDVSTFGSILLHLRDPFRALSEAARITDRALVVTDLLPDVIFGDESAGLMEFNPGDEGENLVNWWRCSPGSIRKMFRVLGFPRVDFQFFENAYHPGHRTDAPPDRRFMFAAVGQREPGLAPRTEITPREAEQDREIRRLVPAINVANYNEVHARLIDEQLKVEQAHAILLKIYQSLPYKLTKPLRMLFGDPVGRGGGEKGISGQKE